MNCPKGLCAPSVFRVEQGGICGWSTTRRVAGDEDGEAGRT